MATKYESGSQVAESYNYDANNRLTTTNRGGALTSSRAYDAAGQVTQTISYSSPGSISERRESTYNVNGQLAQQDVFNGAGALTQRTIYTGYDGAGNVASYQSSVYTGTAYTNYYSYAYARYDGYKEQTVNGSSSYFAPGATTVSFDVNGNTVSVSETFATSKNRSFLTTTPGQILQKTENGQTQYYFYANDKPIGSSGALSSADFDYNYTPVSAQYPGATPGSYVVSQGDTLASIALAVFGDPKLWYIIADANGLNGNGDLRVGQQLTIPNKITNLHNNDKTFKVYNPSEIIGDTTPTLPDPPPPPEAGGKRGCGGIGQLLVIIVTIVVAIYAPQALGMVQGSFGSALVSAAAGNVAGQVTANAVGIQHGFDFGSFATSVVSAGIAQGINVPSLKEGAGFNLSTAARAGITSVVNQGLNIVVGRQDRFDWRGVAAAAIAAPFAAGALNSISGAAEFDGTRIPGVGNIDFGSRFTGGLAGGTAAAIVRMAVYGGGKMNFSAMAADAFGNSIGNSIVGAMQPRPEVEEQPRQQGSGIQVEEGTGDHIVMGKSIDGSGTDLSGLALESGGGLLGGNRILLASNGSTAGLLADDGLLAGDGLSIPIGGNSTVNAEVSLLNAAQSSDGAGAFSLSGGSGLSFGDAAWQFTGATVNGFLRSGETIGSSLGLGIYSATHGEYSDTVFGRAGSFLADEALTIRDQGFYATETGQALSVGADAITGTLGQLYDRGLGAFGDGYDFAINKTSRLFEGVANYFSGTSLDQKIDVAGNLTGSLLFDAGLAAASKGLRLLGRAGLVAEDFATFRNVRPSGGGSFFDIPGPGPRGEAIEVALGKNTPSIFKTFDRFENGTATSIKSYDLSLPSYADPEKGLGRLASTIRRDIRSVEIFEGDTVKGFTITPDDIKVRALEVVIQANRATPAQINVMKGLVDYARQRSVQVNYVVIP